MNNNILFLPPDEVQGYIATHPGTVILDIRTSREHDEQRIPGSINLDFSELSPKSIAHVLPNKSRTVMVYCRAGIHSKTAVAILRRCGYNAIDIGSIHDWCGDFTGRLV